jgi:thioredoxin reductase/5-methylcytosine-specific restriction endonuclease McrA
MYKPAKPVKNIIVGAGPAGIQLGYFFQKAGIEYIILEKAEKAGSFFDKYPHSGKLISINKKHTGSDMEDFNLRHDWNSLLSEDGPKFTDYSDDFYPDSKDLTRYLNDFAEKFKLNIKYNTTVEKIRQKDNGYIVALSDSAGKWIYSCEKLIVATGMGNPDISDIEDTTKTIKHYADYEKDYFKDPDNLAEFNGKTILLIGNGNSSYELANLLTPHCGSILILGRSEKEWAMFSHYAGDLRSTYLGFHDTFLLKSLNAFDAQQAKLKIKLTDEYLSKKKLLNDIQINLLPKLKSVKSNHEKESSELRTKIVVFKKTLQGFKHLKRKANERERTAKINAFESKNRSGAQLIKEKLLKSLKSKYDWKCIYCSKVSIVDLAEADHIHPVNKGGLTTIQNMVLICKDCNSKKSNKTLRVFCIKNNFIYDEICLRLEKLGKDV